MLLFVLLFVLPPSPVSADEGDEDSLIQFNVPEQRVDLALTQFAEQAGITLLFPTDIAGDVMANRLVGKYSVLEGAEILLAGTELIPVSKNMLVLNIVRDPNNNNGENVVKNPKSKLAIAAVLAGGLIQSNAIAQETGETGAQEKGVIEEVIVTATKHSRSIQDIPVSISAITGQDLEARGIRDMHDLKFATPSLQYGSVLGGHNITIRGIGAFDRQPGVAVSVDGVFQTKDTTSQMNQLDLERVEIARGPQGTLYGRNANGGVINFITAAPTQHHEGFIRAGFAEFDQLSVQGVYSGPITDRVSIRVAVDHLDMGEGWVENKAPGGEDQMQGEKSNARVRLAVELTDNLSADFSYSIGKSNGPQDQLVWITDNRNETTEAYNPGISDEPISLKAFETYEDFPIDSDREYELISLTFNWDLGWGQLKSITALQDFDDMFNGADALQSDYNWSTDISATESFTQEFNLLGESGKFDWVVGAFYLDDDYTRQNIQEGGRPAVGLPTPYLLDFSSTEYNTTSLAFFADATWNITDSFRLSGGLRHTKDEIEETHTIDYYLFFTPDSEFAISDCDQSVEEDWEEVTYRFAAQYDLSDQSNLYGSYSNGYKAGAVGLFECKSPYDPETVDAYEIGYKARFGDGATVLSAAAFYYDYADFQVSQIVGTAAFTTNAGDADILGLELELASYITDQWLLSAGLTLLDTEYGDFINFDGMHPEEGFQNVKGNALNGAPETSVNVGVQYSMPAFAGELTLRADVAYRSRVYFREFGTREDSQDAYTVLNLNAGWKSNTGKWEGRLFAKNATEEEYVAFLGGIESLGGRFGGYGPPRQIGMEITRRFGMN